MPALNGGGRHGLDYGNGQPTMPTNSITSSSQSSIKRGRFMFISWRLVKYRNGGGKITAAPAGWDIWLRLEHVIHTHQAHNMLQSISPKARAFWIGHRAFIVSASVKNGLTMRLMTARASNGGFFYRQRHLTMRLDIGLPEDLKSLTLEQES